MKASGPPTENARIRPGSGIVLVPDCVRDVLPLHFPCISLQPPPPKKNPVLDVVLRVHGEGAKGQKKE